MKKILSVLSLVLAIIMVLCSGVVFAEETTDATAQTLEVPQIPADIQAILDNLTESEGLEFESNGDGTCTITGIGTCTDEILVIPAKSPAGDTVTLIAEYAFQECEEFKYVVLANSTVTVDEYAFQSCELETLIVSDSEIEISDRALRIAKILFLFTS